MEWVRLDAVKAYDEIKRKIITLELAPGSSIDEEALAAELNLPAAAVREALRLLVHDNLVIVTPRHGIRVADANPAELQQLFEMRLPLETLCARLAAERATTDDLTVMDALVREYEWAKQEEKFERLLDLDHRFHKALAEAAHNRYMREALEQLFGLSERLWYLALPQVNWLLVALDRHAAVVKAIKARDGDTAAGLMAEHVRDFEQQVERALRRS